MKKLLTFIIAIMFALCVCGCGDNASLPQEPQESDSAVTADTTEQEAEPEKAPEVADVKGSVSGDVYENSYMSVKFTKPSGWTFSTQEEIDSIFGIFDASADSANFCDMMVIDGSTGNNINVVITMLDAGESVDLDEYLTQSEAEIAQIGAALGLENEFSEHETVKLGDVDFMRVEIEQTYNDVKMYQASYVACQNGVIMSITITINDGTPFADIEAMFS